MHIDLCLQAVAASSAGLLAVLRNELTDERVEFESEQIVVDRGTSPLNDLFDSLRDKSVNQGVTNIDSLLANQPQPGLDSDGFALFRIGDAVSSRSLHAALLDAYRLATTL